MPPRQNSRGIIPPKIESGAESERVLLLVGLSADSSFHTSVSPQVSKIELLGSIKKEGAITLSALVHIFGQQSFSRGLAQSKYDHHSLISTHI